MTVSRTARRRLATALPVAALLTLTGCTAFSGPEATETDQAPAPGDADEELPSEDEIPEAMDVSTIDPISAGEVVILDSSRALEVPLLVVDPTTGAVTARIVTGSGLQGPVVHPFVGQTADDAAVVAAEVWRPRGSRGAAEFTISTYAGDLLEPREILLPDSVRPHSGWGSSVVTDDGRYFVFWDYALYGPRVIDLGTGTETGAQELEGCGPFTWADGHDVYSVCERSRELLHLRIQDDGSLAEARRAEVLPEDFVSNRQTSYAYDADKALLVSANGDVFVLDLADGLPSSAVEPVGNAGQDSGRFSQYLINNPGSSLAITYTDSEIHPRSARGGDTDRVILYDATTFEEVATLTLDSLGLSWIESHAYSVDGDTLYVQGESDDEELTLVGIDAATGEETSRVVVEDFVGEPGRMLTPRALG